MEGNFDVVQTESFGFA